MAISIVCKHCGCTEGMLKTGSQHVGLYCKKCFKWVKWISKDEYEKLASQELIVEEAKEDLIYHEEINIENLKRQRDELDKQINEFYKKETEKIIKNNESYIGKTYKRLTKADTISYYKIIGVDEDNQYRMNTLVFTLPISQFKASSNIYNEESIMSIENIGWFCNNLNYSYDWPSKEIDNYTEISSEEYFLAFHEWLEKIKEVAI